MGETKEDTPAYDPCDWLDMAEERAATHLRTGDRRERWLFGRRLNRRAR